MTAETYAPPCEDAVPNPEFLIKSIAEQGYSLESSLADLIDNSISALADRIEILVNMEENPFTMFIADNGAGMDEENLRSNMQFPSNSPSSKRNETDLGRFGLGMKTASFAQTRKLTVISRKKGTEKFAGRTWDVDHLTNSEKWQIIVNSPEEINVLLEKYKYLSENYQNQFEELDANTIIVWQGLYKYENYVDIKNRTEALKSEVNDVTNEHLSIVFHRFMERQDYPVKIRVNNLIITSFNPFRSDFSDVRSIEYKHRTLNDDTIKLEGFVLPSRSISESKEGNSVWTTRTRSLMDMEGIYIYRSGRLIRFGGWNGIIKKSPRLQLARLMVEVGNSVDHLIHLNVAKSQITIPFELRHAFYRYIIDLTKEAEKEYYNTGNSTHLVRNKKDNHNLFQKKATTRGVVLRFNEEFAVLKSLRMSLNKKQNSSLNMLLKIIDTSINKVRQVHEEKSFVSIPEEDGIPEDGLITAIEELIKEGITKEHIKINLIPLLGFTYESLPTQIKKLLQK